ncbi:MAG: phospho-N-acetylmuramoyl-pentapeptide-transferase [Actinomycetia bacterium]|nr:phospho-N-acetylmuramoyl-pentapeptide-transferase [Actinomycetes bacterium]
MKMVLGAGLIALVVTLVGTRWLIGALARRHYGQFVRDDGPSTHSIKRGTPTMGGLVLIIACVVAYAGAHLVMWQRPSASALLVLGLFVATGLLGLADDWSKISHKRSLGLSARTKLAGQLLIGVTFSVLALRLPDGYHTTPASTAISFTRDIEALRLPVVLAVVWMTVLITGFSNAVNLTDGLDGLATGASTMVFAAFVLINIWQYGQWCERATTAGARCYVARNPYDLAVVAVALAAACFGFLWWNARPAGIFLGDTGSLALGAAMAGLAVVTRTELLLFLLGALFVVETASVIIQVGWFKASHGKRVFKMAPLHHHFELLGWAEETVVVRFWIICGLTIVVGFGIFYGEWVLGQ